MMLVTDYTDRRPFAKMIFDVTTAPEGGMKRLFES